MPDRDGEGSGAPPGSPPSTDLAGLAELGDDRERVRYFTGHPELLGTDLVWRLAAESGRLLRVDLRRAEALADTAGWLAGELGDLKARARALRATGGVRYFQRRYDEAVRIYERAVEAFTEAGADLEAAIARSSALASLANLSRYDQAMAFATAARRTFEELGDRLRLGRLENNVGMILSRQDRFPKALERYRRAYDLFRELGQPADVAISLRNIAVCYQDLNDFHASLEVYLQARAYCETHGQALVGLEVEYNIAYLYYLRGEYSEAIRLFEKARRYSREQGDRHHAALCDLDLAEIFLELNLVHDARYLAEKSFAAFEELGMAYETAKALSYRAIAEARRGESEPALELLDRARELFDRQQNRVWVAMVELYKARILFAEAEFARAAEHAESAFRGFVDCGVPSRITLCQILRARLAVALGDLEAAREHCASALAHTLETDRPLIEFQAHLTSGQIDEAAGNPHAAWEAYLRAHGALERMRGQLRTDELKIAFTDDKQAVYEGLVNVILAGGHGEAERETTFRYVETAKSRSLADLLAMGSPGVGTATADNPLAGQLRELRQELNWLYRQISNEELGRGDPAAQRLETLRADARRRERRLLRTLRRLQGADAELSSLQGSTVADLATIRAALPQDACLVEYFIARGLLYLFILDSERLEARRLGDVESIRKLHRQLQFQFGKFAVGGDYMKRFGEMFEAQTVALLGELHGALFGDWRPAAAIRHLVVVPHGFLHQIPFHALHDGDRFLIDDLRVSYAPSATVFQLCSSRRVACEERSLVLGVPDARAPKIVDEVQAVARMLPHSTLLVGPEATRESLSELGNGCRFVHIATHGLYRKDNPMFSAIQLGDTRLSLLDLYDVRLEAELAVLSGCGTGLSDVRGSDELVGLTRGLLHAGARSVMATLWDVNDESTEEFMRHFYGSLTRGFQPARALQRATAALRRQYAHPYHWAPFVLIGHP